MMTLAEPSPTTVTHTQPDRCWELVRQVQAGDRDAFGTLYEMYVDVVFRYCLFRTGNREVAEDLTSETFLRALRRISSVSYQGRDIGAWFVTIARNLVLDRAKSAGFIREKLYDGPEHLPAQRTPDEPAEGAVASELAVKLREALPALSRNQRECIELRFFGQLSVAETATVMHRNEGSVKALQHRAIRRLAQLLPPSLLITT